MTASSPPSPPSFDPAALQRLLDGEQAPVRRRVREILSRPSFRYLPPDAGIDAQRAAASAWCQELADEGIGALLSRPNTAAGAITPRSRPRSRRSRSTTSA